MRVRCYDHIGLYVYRYCTADAKAWKENDRVVLALIHTYAGGDAENTFENGAAGRSSDAKATRRHQVLPPAKPSKIQCLRGVCMWSHIQCSGMTSDIAAIESEMFLSLSGVCMCTS